MAPPFNPDDPENIAKDLKVEREAHKELVRDNGRPCYPIEVGFEVFKHPAQYKEIFSYWQSESGVGEDTERWIFFLQLERWKRFRHFQQRNRRYFVPHGRFPEFQQQVLERRRRHGLDGNVQLLEDSDKQNQLDEWMEYQDYEFREYERLEKDLNETQERLASNRKMLAEAGVSAFEGIQELEFGSYYSLVLEWGGKEAKAEREVELAKRKLRLAEKRLKIAESDDLGERVERATWVGLFLKQVESAQVRLAELQYVAENAERDLEPFNRWLQTRHVEWYEKGGEETEEGKRRIGLEVESAEYKEKSKKREELEKRAHEAGMTHFRAEKEVEFLKEGYQAAQMDDIGETIEKAALFKVLQEEVRSAQVQLEETRESAEKLKLKTKVVGGLGWISNVKGKMRRQNILLEWIEQQRQEIVISGADAESQGDQGRSKRANSRLLGNHSTTEASRSKKPTQATSRKRKQSLARSTLHPSRVAKAPRKRRNPRPKISVPCDTSQAAEKTTDDLSIPQSRTKQASKIQDIVCASLRPIHSSRISKPSSKRSTKLSRDGTNLPPTTGERRPQRENKLGTPSTSSTGRKVMQQFANTSLRRSTRISKQPERFRPGYT